MEQYKSTYTGAEIDAGIAKANTAIQDISGKQNVIDSSHKLNADLVDDTSATNKFVTASEKTTWNAKSDFSGSYNDLSNKPTIPDELADLSDDSTHRLVTDTEKTAWDSKGTYSKPSGGIPTSDLAFTPVETTGDQTVAGVKTFSSLPQSSGVPANNNDLANKKYVDDSIASAITTTLGGSY